MNIEKITEYGARTSKALTKLNIKNPVLLDGDRVLVADAFSAFVLTSAELAEMASGNNPAGTGNRIYNAMTADFKQQAADVSGFVTSLGDLVTWLRKDTEPCSFCLGQDICPSVEIDDADETSPELDDANALHYGWLGVAPIRRSRLDVLLSYLELPGDTSIEVMSVMNDRPATYDDGEQAAPFYGAVWIKGADFELVLAGLSEKTEVAPKFQLEGVFTAVKVEEAGKKKGVGKKAVVEKKPKHVKAAFPVKREKKAATKAVVKPVAKPVKAEPKKPVTKTKVVTKQPLKSSGSALLDRARAKKAAGRGKK